MVKPLVGGTPEQSLQEILKLSGRNCILYIRRSSHPSAFFTTKQAGQLNVMCVPEIHL